MFRKPGTNRHRHGRAASRIVRSISCTRQSTALWGTASPPDGGSPEPERFASGSLGGLVERHPVPNMPTVTAAAPAKSALRGTAWPVGASAAGARRDAMNVRSVPRGPRTAVADGAAFSSVVLVARSLRGDTASKDKGLGKLAFTVFSANGYKWQCTGALILPSESSELGDAKTKPGH